MSKKIAIIDCAIKAPAANSIRSFLESQETRDQISIAYDLVAHTKKGQELENIKKEDSTGSIDMVWILGSSSSVHDQLDWQKKVASFAMEKLQQGIPVLGICFGHQLMAKTIGGEVGFLSPDESLFSGVREISWSSDFPSLDSSQLIFHHKEEVKSLKSPEDWIHAASSDICKYESIIHKKLPFWGIQAHPEASWHFIKTHFVESKDDSQDEKKRDKDFEKAMHNGYEFLNFFLKYKMSIFR